MRSPGRAALAGALVPLGTIAGHVVGYWLAGDDASFDGAHRHLRPTVWLTVAVAAAAVAWVTIRPVGSRSAPRLSWLVSGQLAGFFLLEAAEHVLAGHAFSELPGHPTLRWGLLAQIVSAGVLVLVTRLAGASGQRVRAFLSRTLATRGAPAARTRPGTPDAVRSILVVSAASERGPPPVLLIA